jgi:hypothetical protein
MLFARFPVELSVDILLHWLDTVLSCIVLDTASCTHLFRPKIVETFKLSYFVVEGYHSYHLNASCMRWLVLRDMKLSQLDFGLITWKNRSFNFDLNMSKLIAIRVSNCGHPRLPLLTESQIIKLLNLCPSLEILYISFVATFTSTVFNHISTSTLVNKLKSLSFFGNYDNNSLKTLLASCVALESICLYFSTPKQSSINETDLISIFNRNKKLVHFTSDIETSSALFRFLKLTNGLNL